MCQERCSRDEKSFLENSLSLMHTKFSKSPPGLWGGFAAWTKEVEEICSSISMYRPGCAEYVIIITMLNPI